ncbi:integral membrane protein-like protein [Macrophomina phaseolina]|uniref:Integral membrane protein-like protein n=1 Tax=Macrophomina phaseolina TaxID=35725 RepID=A0ABQ8G7Q5_9PEZI|nr:integral membrane protein-like protein [Macrophomina phaseolina]
MASSALIPFLVGMMLLTGVCNTLLTKYQDQQCVRDCDTKHPHFFEQPVVQTAQMFIGEMGCWLVVGGFSLYNHFASKRSVESGGYEAVPRESTDEPAPPSAADIEATADTPDSASSDAPIANPLKSAHGDDHSRRPLTGWKVTYLALPAICDIAGTTLMNVGLLFVAASIYQMTRGALVLFVGLFSVLFLKRHLGLYKWVSLFIVVAGVALVGLAGALAKDSSAHGASIMPAGQMPMGDKYAFSGTILVRSAANEVKAMATPLAVRTIIGVLLIAGAQIFTASQFVLEESIMENYELEPLKVVGWEGIFGFLVTVIVMIVMHFAVGTTRAGRGGYFDAREGLYEITHFPAIAISSILIMFSIGGFNFFGLSVTRSVSATARATIDTCRTLFIWVVSLGLGWETFKWLQVAGFALLVYGTFLFNDIVRPPLRAYLEWKRKKRSGIDELLPEGPIEHM